MPDTAGRPLTPASQKPSCRESRTTADGRPHRYESRPNPESSCTTFTPHTKWTKSTCNVYYYDMCLIAKLPSVWGSKPKLHRTSLGLGMATYVPIRCVHYHHIPSSFGVGPRPNRDLWVGLRWPYHPYSTTPWLCSQSMSRLSNQLRHRHRTDRTSRTTAPAVI